MAFSPNRMVPKSEPPREVCRGLWDVDPIYLTLKSLLFTLKILSDESKSQAFLGHFDLKVKKMGSGGEIVLSGKNIH